MLILLWGGPAGGQAVNHDLARTDPGSTIPAAEYGGGRYRIVVRLPEGSKADYLADWTDEPQAEEVSRMADLEAQHASDQGTISDLEAGGVTDRDTIATLEADGVTDRDMIATLEASGVVDRDTIADLQAGGVTDRDMIATLEAVGLVDRGMIADLEADGIIVRDRVANLEIALVSARHIGGAIGLIMALRRISEAEAFEVLREASRTTHRKLRDVASDVLLIGRPG